MRLYFILAAILFSTILFSQNKYNPLSKPNTYNQADNPNYWKNKAPAGYWQQDVYYEIDAEINEKFKKHSVFFEEDFLGIGEFVEGRGLVPRTLYKV